MTALAIIFVAIVNYALGFVLGHFLGWSSGWGTGWDEAAEASRLVWREETAAVLAAERMMNGCA